nr:LysR substrate-binding domain-containing protein [Staphylococcus sp. SNAZ 59]
MLFNSDFYLNDKIKNTCRDYGFNPNMIFETTQWSFIEEMLLNNLGICILPEGILELLDNNLKAIDINEPGTDMNSTTQVVDLTDSTINANSRYFDNESEVPKQAVSMGLAYNFKS